MAIIRWISTSGHGGQTASWEGGVVPTGPDIALLDGTSQVSWTDGVGRTDGAAATIYATEDYTGDIGGSGAYLTQTGTGGAGASVVRSVFNHRGKLYYYMDDNASGTANLSAVIIGMPLAGVDNAHLDGNFGALYIKDGGVTLDATLTIDSATIEIFGGRTLISSGVTLANGTTVKIYGGYVESQLSMTPTLYGGRLFQRKLLTGLSIFGGAHVRYIPVPFATGNMTLNLWYGSLNLVGNPADVFSAVTTGANFGPDFRLIGDTDIAAVGRLDLRDDFPVIGT